MDLKDKNRKEIELLLKKLDIDRVWLLEQIDKGYWSEFRVDLAALERELGQLVSRAYDELDK